MFDFKRENCQEWTTVKFTIYPHMNKTILLGLALAASVSSASAYHADKYDGQFGMSWKGLTESQPKMPCPTWPAAI